MGIWHRKSDDHDDLKKSEAFRLLELALVKAHMFIDVWLRPPTPVLLLVMCIYNSSIYSIYIYIYMYVHIYIYIIYIYICIRTPSVARQPILNHLSWWWKKINFMSICVILCSTCSTPFWWLWSRYLQNPHVCWLGAQRSTFWWTKIALKNHRLGKSTIKL